MSREKMHELLDLSAGIKYSYETGPLLEHADLVFDVGINCQLLAHVVLEELGYGLPKDLRSKELYEDTVWTKQISPESDGWRPGDLLFSYAYPEGFDPKQLHISVCIAVEAGVPHFLHALKFTDSSKDAITVWKLDDFAQSNTHRHLISAKRVR